MADNVTLPGTGLAVASEDVGGVEYQRMKIVDGLAGGTTPAKVNADNEQAVSVDDMAVAFIKALGSVIDGLAMDPITGRLRVSVDAIAAALTLATVTTVTGVTTVATVTKASQLGSLGVDASSTVYDMMDTGWSSCVRGRIV